MEIRLRLFKKDQLMNQMKDQMVTYHKNKLLMNEIYDLGMSLSGKFGERFYHEEHIPNWFNHPEPLVKQVLIDFIDGEDHEIDQIIQVYLASFEQRHAPFIVYQTFQLKQLEGIQLGINFFVKFRYNQATFEQVLLIDAFNELGFNQSESITEWKNREQTILEEFILSPSDSDVKESVIAKQTIPHVLKETVQSESTYIEVPDFENAIVLDQQVKELEDRNNQLKQQVKELKESHKKIQKQNKVLAVKLDNTEEETMVETKKTTKKVYSTHNKKMRKISVDEYKSMIGTIHYLEYTWSSYQKYMEDLDASVKTSELQATMKQVREKRIHTFIFNDWLTKIIDRVVFKQIPFVGRSVAILSERDYQICCQMEEQYYLMRKAISLIPKIS